MFMIPASNVSVPVVVVILILSVVPDVAFTPPPTQLAPALTLTTWDETNEDSGGFAFRRDILPNIEFAALIDLMIKPASELPSVTPAVASVLLVDVYPVVSNPPESPS